MFRFIFVILVVTIFLICSIPLLLILEIVGIFNKESKENISSAVISWAFGMIASMSGVKLTVVGEENIAQNENVLYVGNHRSIFDIILLYHLIKKPAVIISKKEMNRIPVFNIWERNIGCLFLDRKDIKQGLQIILQAIEIVKTKASVIIFPEGTRSKTEGEFLPFKAGSFKISEKSKCSVIPVTFINTGCIFEDHKPFIKKTHVVVCFGEPIVTKDYTRDDFKELHTLAYNKVVEMYNINKGLAD